MIDLQTFYLTSIEAAAEAEKYQAVLHVLEKNAGRLYFIPERGTRSDVVIDFVFGENFVNFTMVMRNGHTEMAQCHYVEGIDHFIAGVVKALRSGLLAAPKTPTGRRAA